METTATSQISASPAAPSLASAEALVVEWLILYWMFKRKIFLAA